MKKMICFDLDGTLVDLYNVPNWLEMLRAYDPTPYKVAKPMWDMAELAKVLTALQAQGWEIRVVTWLSKETDEAYKEAVRIAKREWLAQYGFPYDHFHGVQYGTTKADCVRAYAETAILFDDNAGVRKGWHLGGAIDPAEFDIIEVLRGLLGE